MVFLFNILRTMGEANYLQLIPSKNYQNGACCKKVISNTKNIIGYFWWYEFAVLSSRSVATRKLKVGLLQAKHVDCPKYITRVHKIPSLDLP